MQHKNTLIGRAGWGFFRTQAEDYSRGCVRTRAGRKRDPLRDEADAIQDARWPVKTLDPDGVDGHLYGLVWEPVHQTGGPCRPFWRPTKAEAARDARAAGYRGHPVRVVLMLRMTRNR